MAWPDTSHRWWPPKWQRKNRHPTKTDENQRTCSAQDIDRNQSCRIHVDPNVVRAGIAATPDESEFTSAFDCIRTRWRRTQDAHGKTPVPFFSRTRFRDVPVVRRQRKKRRILNAPVLFSRLSGERAWGSITAWFCVTEPGKHHASWLLFRP